jgi:hypothetical protein
MIELDHITKRFGEGPAANVAVDDLTLTIAPGEVVVQDHDVAHDQPADPADIGEHPYRR